MLIKVDALFLLAASINGVVADLSSYFSGAGAFGDTFFRDPVTLGVVEAHGLAMLTAVAAWFVGLSAPRYWHWHLAATHALLGGANIFFFDLFTRVGAETGGIAVTAIHFAFAILQAGAATFGGRNR